MSNLRSKKILSHINTQCQVGLEIGPLCRPIVTRDMGKVFYVDVATTEELKVKYASDPDVSIDEIVDIDYVWGSSSLTELVEDKVPFDYLIASHVIEHVPDFIGWLQEVHTILRDDGILSLVIPNKLCCFDYYRQNTKVADILDSYIRKSRKPSPRQIFDYLSSAVRWDGRIAWDCLEKVESEKLSFIHSEEIAWQITQDAVSNDSYVDSHCWVFTPESFFNLLKSLINLNLFDFDIKQYYPTSGCEFYVSLQALNKSSLVLESRRTNQLECVESILKNIESEYSSQTLYIEEIGIDSSQNQSHERITKAETITLTKLRSQYFFAIRKLFKSLIKRK